MNITKIEFLLSQLWGICEVTKTSLLSDKIELEAIYSTIDVALKLIDEIFQILDKGE